MKVGNKLLCKKSGELKSRKSYLGNAKFHKDHYYEILDGWGRVFIIRGEDESTEVSFYWDDKGWGIQISEIRIPRISDIRKEKLEQIELNINEAR